MTPTKILQQQLKDLSVDAIFVSNPHNIRFLSGFTDGHDAKLLVTKTGAFLLTDFRLLAQAKSQAKGWDIVDISKGFFDGLRSLLERHRVKILGIESGHITLGYHKHLKKHLAGVKLHTLEHAIEELRIVKSSEELKHLRRACKLTSRAFSFLRQTIRLGMSEIELAWKLECFLREHKSEGLSFPSICASGPNSANPHHLNTKRTFKRGDALILDFGAVIGGMHADMTRTVFLSKPSDLLANIYSIVLSAQTRAAKGVKAGVLASDIDALARDTIKDAGHGDAFGHSTGHGIGYEVHERPSISSRYPHPLKAGSSITVEPGIYLAGKGGVRIEDDVLVLKTRGEFLTTAPRSLRAMILDV